MCVCACVCEHVCVRAYLSLAGRDALRVLYTCKEVAHCVREREGGYLVSCTTECLQLKCVFRI